MNDCEIQVTFIVVDVSTRYPLFGRDWMYLLKFDVPELLKRATWNCKPCIGTLSSQSILSDYADIFREVLGLLKGIEASITVDPSAVPKFHRHRSVPFALKEKVEAALQAQVDEGELVAVEQSEWAAPIVVVNKRDGGIRICGDFKVSVNPVISPQVYPLPNPEEMFSTPANRESFSKLDLARAYKQMRVTDSSRPLLAINTHVGLFQYTGLPFGISTAPALWQKAMSQVLHGIPGVVYFIDDILVTGHTRTEHEANLHQVLGRIREYGLRLNKAKCVFFQNELEFLGYLISSEGIKPTQSRVRVIHEAPAPPE